MPVSALLSIAFRSLSLLCGRSVRVLFDGRQGRPHYVRETGIPDTDECNIVGNSYPLGSYSHACIPPLSRRCSKIPHQDGSASESSCAHGRLRHGVRLGTADDVLFRGRAYPHFAALAYNPDTEQSAGVRRTVDVRDALSSGAMR